MRRHSLCGVLAAAILLAAASACGDSTKPILIPLPEEPTGATLSDFISGPLVEPSAFDMITKSVVRTDMNPGWDFVFFLDPQDGPSLLTRGSYLQDEDDEAAVQVVLSSFDGLTEAPEDGYVVFESVRISVGDVFVTRSRRDPAFGGLRCRYYGKFGVEAIDETEGTLALVHLINPNCENRNLDPGQNP